MLQNLSSAELMVGEFVIKTFRSHANTMFNCMTSNATGMCIVFILLIP